LEQGGVKLERLSVKAKVSVVITWLLFWPSAVLGIYHIYTPRINSGDIVDILALLVLLGITSFLPIKVRGTNILFIQGVSLAVFLQFGLFVELILTQISIVIAMAHLRVGVKDYPRYLTNTLMFLCGSITSGLVYYALEGRTGLYEFGNFPHFTPILGYALTFFVTNHILLYLRDVIVYRSQQVSFWGKDMWWEMITTSIVLPFGLILYILYAEIGTAAIFFVGFPFISISLMIRLYHSTEKINNLLHQTSDVGHQLTERLYVDDTLNLFMDKVSKMLNSDYIYILDTENRNRFSVLRFMENGIVKEPPISSFEQISVSGKAFAEGKSIRFEQRDHWENKAIGFLPDTVESIISIPMQRNQHTVGVITLASKQKRMFEKHHVTILEILANSLAVAIENAKNYELTKQQSERCGLTGLYNYRYFEGILEKMYSTYNMDKKQFSIILLDLDHFKLVNDTYGHQSGNEVLCQLATRLKMVIGDNGTVARYGGEEFVILLPKTPKEKCYKTAETIRKAIANKPFSVQDDLKKDGKKYSILVTASIGIATAPEQGDDPMSLIRHADRAMYTGAKQKGRNKVATYISG
jgi:diguanylate cyclase (GGDEF)-like protein